MSTERDLPGILHDWLHEDAHEDGDRVLDGVLDLLDSTEQRPPSWLARRFPLMNSSVIRYGLAALVVVVAVIGLRTVAVGPAPGSSPSAAPSPTASASSQASDFSDALNGFLAARIAGTGAEQYLGSDQVVPLLYATTLGAPYQRSEFEPIAGIEWPYGLSAFRVRLYAGDTTVEQLVFAGPDSPLIQYVPDGFGTHIAPTTENGQPIPAPYSAFDGAVTLNTVHPWVSRYGSGAIRLIPDDPGVHPSTDGGERNEWDLLLLLADPEVVGPAGDGCPLGGPATDAATLAESLRSNTEISTTAPIAVAAGGVNGVMMDVIIAHGARVCDDGGVFSLLVDKTPGTTCYANASLMDCAASGEWMRLYLFDAPAGSSFKLLVIAVVAPASRFESVAASAVPIVDSINFPVP